MPKQACFSTFFMVHPEYGVIEYLGGNKNNKNIGAILCYCFFCLSLYIFSEWHIVPMLKIQIKP